MTSYKKTTSILIIFAVVVAAVLVGIYWGGRTKSKLPEGVPPIPEQGLERFSVSETEAGKPHWVLEAVSAQILENEKKVLLQSPRIKFYQKGEYVSTLVAAKGRINTDTYDIWGEGKCILTTAKGETLETSNLNYKSDIKKIITQENVKLTRPHETVYGRGMEATPDLETIKIRNQRVELNDNR